MFYTYVIQSTKSDYWYTGSTKDLRKRFNQHNTGKSTYTMTFFSFEKNKGRANVSCYDKYLTKKREVFIAVSIQSQQVSAWVDSNYGVK